MPFGLVLGGGGIKGAAHLGVLQTLADNDIRPDIIVGTSAGSIAATLYSTGYLKTAISMKTLPFSFINPDNYRFTGLPLGIINGHYIENILKKILGRRKLSDLKPLTAVVACDLASGETVVYTACKPVIPFPPDIVMGGDVEAWQSVRASISIPLLFAPFKIRTRLLVDGGLTANVPADIAHYLGADRIVAVDLSSSIPKHSFRHAGEVILQSLDIISQRNKSLVLEQYADIILSPVKEPVGAWDISKFNSLVTAGIKETKLNLSKIRKLIN